MMKKSLKITSRIAALLLVVVAGWSCMADVNMYEPSMNVDGLYVTAFGDIAGEEHCIVTDDGVSLCIATLGGGTSWQEVESKVGRVLFNYTVLDNNPQGGFYVRLNRFYPLDIKDMVLFGVEDVSMSGVESIDGWKDEDFVSLLKYPTMPYEVRVGGGYVNVNVCYTSTEQTPDVELYYDATSSTIDTAVLQLVGESPSTNGVQAQYRWFSFRIVEEVLPLIANASTYSFYWCWWAEEGNPEAGVEEYISEMSVDLQGF